MVFYLIFFGSLRSNCHLSCESLLAQAGRPSTAEKGKTRAEAGFFQNKSAATNGEPNAVYCVVADRTDMGRFQYST